MEKVVEKSYQETEFLPRQNLKELLRTRDQIANIRWIMENAREFQQNIYFCFIDDAKAFDCVDIVSLGIIFNPSVSLLPHHKRGIILIPTSKSVVRNK